MTLYKFFAIVALFVSFLSSHAFSNNAKVQIIHNSADKLADKVDIYVNGTLEFDDFGFREATPFIELPSQTDIFVAIQPSNSTNAENPLALFKFNLEPNVSYTVIASGIVSDSGYEPTIPFDLIVYPNSRDIATDPNFVDINVFHGSTDAPKVDVVESGVGAGTIINDLGYGQFSGYLSLPAEDYIIDIRDETGETIVARYSVPLKTLKAGGTALNVFASGFLNPGVNSDGLSFGLFAAAADGTVIEIPLYNEEVSKAKVQIIHNSADKAAQQVDIYVNGILAFDNFEFRMATPYTELPSGVDLEIAIQPSDSESAENPLALFVVNLEPDTYTVIASGIVSQNGYEPRVPFNLHMFKGSVESSESPNNVVVNVFHGATDAPDVDVVETGIGAGTLIDYLGFGEFSGNLSLPVNNYVIEVRDETGTATVATYEVPLQNLNAGGLGLNVFASGFLNPSNNSEGDDFGLYAALPDGTVLKLQSVTANVEDDFSLNQINVYPNPANDNVNIEINTELDYLNMDLFDQTGLKIRNLYNGKMNSDIRNLPVSLSGLSSGVYYVRIDTGKKTIFKAINVIK